MELTGAQMILESLAREGVTDVFGLPGGATLPLYDALPEYYPRIRHYLVKHEQAAAHAADAYARVTNGPGVCFATSGPGATNLVTGIANAWMDSVPLVCITGAVITGLLGRDGFQEADITGITIPITKHNALVLDVREIPRVIREAFYIARSGRPGPVLVDIPRDVQQQRAEFVWPDRIALRGYRPQISPDPEEVAKAADLINSAERPLILAGHGVIISGAYEELQGLAEKTNIPVITTLLGISGFPASHPLYLGMPGMHGMYWNNIAISESDLLIGVGMRFDDRVTGRLKDFAPDAKIVHLEVDPAEVGKNVRPAATLQGDARVCLQELNQLVESRDRRAWFEHIESIKREHPSVVFPESEAILPQYAIKKIYELSGSDYYVVTGVGQHQMWAAQYFRSDKPNSWVTSGGLGTMGFEVPAAMGVQAAKPAELVWSICGDGGFQMTLQELATIAEYGWPIKFAIINNGHHGMVRQWQHLFYKNNLVASPLRNPDFVKLAEAFGILGLQATQQQEVEPVIQRALEHDGPVVIDFRVKDDEDCYPMVPPGASLQETVDLPPEYNALAERAERVKAK
ncbi:MAG TPA: biosynthetic-type acetolactate synthase large subunit [Dehalococcoidia bacterium]|nr:biosynthetic-type acetolactate synthase large subunit [Dehalococcoidia bacterium]